jgi:hypothetical protein
MRPILIDGNCVSNFIDLTTIDDSFNASYEELEQTLLGLYGEGKMLSCWHIVENYLNLKEKHMYGDTPEMYGWEYRKFPRKEILKMAKLFAKKITKQAKCQKNIEQEFERSNGLEL